MLSPRESYLNVGGIYGYMTAKFKVGDRVRILNTLTRKDFNEIGIDGNIDKYVGKIDIIEYDGGTHYLLENCGMWFLLCRKDYVRQDWISVRQNLP